MKRDWLEWLVLAGSAAVIVILVGVLAVHGLLGGDGPPDPSVTLHPEQARQAATAWIVPATVRNDGDVAAQSIVIEASANVAGNEEESVAEIDYLAPGTEVELAFGFSAQPDGEVRVRVVSMEPGG